MREIPLTQGKVALVDDEDYQELSKHKWYALKHGNTYYAARTARCKNGGRSTVYLHCTLLEAPKNMEIDHINGDGLNNTRGNLRVVTHRENGQNLHMEKSSKFPGVCWDRRRKKWQTGLQIARKWHYLGSFEDEETAGLIYSMACTAIKMGCVL
jgi:hypothetical protein